MPIKLKPCPFCGEVPTCARAPSLICLVVEHKCLITGALFFCTTSGWNTRHGEPKRLPSPPTVTDVGTNTQPIALISVGAEDREIYFEEGDTQESINARIRAAVDEMSKGCEVTITLDDKEGHWIDDDKDPDPLF